MPTMATRSASMPRRCAVAGVKRPPSGAPNALDAMYEANTRPIVNGLVVCSWSSTRAGTSDPRAVPAGTRSGQVRRWAVDIEIAMEEAAAGVLDLARHKDQLPSRLAGDIRHLLRSLGCGVREQAHQWVATLEHEARLQVPAVRPLAWAAADLLRLVEQWDAADWTTPPPTAPAPTTRSTRPRATPPSSRPSPCWPATCPGSVVVALAVATVPAEAHHPSAGAGRAGRHRRRGHLVQRYSVRSSPRPSPPPARPTR